MATQYLTVNHLSTKDLIGIFSRIAIRSDVAWHGTPCWLWAGDRRKDGYGEIVFRGQRHVRIHRLIFAWLLHPLPRGRDSGELDHLCRRPACCNPIHLEFVPHQVNVLRGQSPFARNARKLQCPIGHPYSGDNLYIGIAGNRQCRACGRTRARLKYQANPVAGRAQQARWRNNNRERYRENARHSYQRTKQSRSKA